MHISSCKQIGRYFQPSDTIWFITYLSHLTMIINSSINFIIYCIVGRRFRKEMFYYFNTSRSSSIVTRARATARTVSINSSFTKQISEISTMSQVSQSTCTESLAKSSKSVSIEDKQSQISEDEFSKFINDE